VVAKKPASQAQAGSQAHTAQLTARPSAGRSFPVMTTDPVCGMTLEESAAKASTDYEGKRYYFCSDACREEFEAHPDQYAGLEEGIGASP